MIRCHFEAIVSTMKIVHTSSNGVDAPGAKRRYYSPELKTQVIQECRQVDASIARVALAHGINANIVHRWLHGRPCKTPTPRVNTSIFA